MYEYFLIALAGQFVANRYCETAFTTDEEQAYAFTSYEKAVDANVMQGEIIRRMITDDELDVLPVVESLLA